MIVVAARVTPVFRSCFVRLPVYLRLRLLKAYSEYNEYTRNEYTLHVINTYMDLRNKYSICIFGTYIGFGT